jgi:hypothetical protein
MSSFLEHLVARGTRLLAAAADSPRPAEVELLEALEPAEPVQALEPAEPVQALERGPSIEEETGGGETNGEEPSGRADDGRDGFARTVTPLRDAGIRSVDMVTQWRDLGDRLLAAHPPTVAAEVAPRGRPRRPVPPAAAPSGTRPADPGRWSDETVLSAEAANTVAGLRATPDAAARPRHDAALFSAADATDPQQDPGGPSRSADIPAVPRPPRYPSRSANLPHTAEGETTVPEGAALPRQRTDVTKRARLGTDGWTDLGALGETRRARQTAAAPPPADAGREPELVIEHLEVQIVGPDEGVVAVGRPGRQQPPASADAGAWDPAARNYLGRW